MYPECGCGTPEYTTEEICKNPLDKEFPLPGYLEQQVLELTSKKLLQTYFNINNWQLNQPILIRDLYILLDKIKGVQTVKSINISNKAGTTSGYSQYAYDISSATQNNVIYPSLDPSIFEVKYLNQDIKGRVVPL
jgi:hypothetical protein